MVAIHLYNYEATFAMEASKLFKLINDDEETKKWSNLFVRNIYEKPSDKNHMRAGITYKSVLKYGRKDVAVDAEILSCNPPYEITIQSDSKQGLTIMAYKLTTIGDATKLKIEVSSIPSNFYYKMMIKLFKRGMNAYYDEQNNRLADHIRNVIEQK